VNFIRPIPLTALIAAATFSFASAHAGGLKINTAKDNPTAVEPASLALTGVDGVPENATDVDVVVIYRDARGTMQIASPGVFASGCYAERGSEGVDVTCPLLDE